MIIGAGEMSQHVKGQLFSGLTHMLQHTHASIYKCKRKIRIIEEEEYETLRLSLL